MPAGVKSKAQGEMSFAEFLVNQTPVFDEMIMEQIRPEDGWLLNVSYGDSWFDDYSLTLTEVRRLSEGMAFKPFKLRRPKREPIGLPESFSRAIFPDTIGEWRRVK
jgi:hypothetical protein